MGGWSGMGLREYTALSDRQIYALLSVEWTEEGGLVRERDRAPQAAKQGSNGHVDRRGFPEPEALGLTDDRIQEALAVNPRPGAGYLMMFFQVWQRRGKSFDETMQLWREAVG